MSAHEGRQTALSSPHAERGRRERVRNLVRWITSPAAHRLALERAPSTTGNQPSSLATCEKVPTSGFDPTPSGDSDHPGVELSDAERDVLTTAYRHGVGDASIDELATAVRHGVGATEALHEVLGREPRRQALVVELILANEVPHAKRLATCGRKSAQLECPETFGAGGCGCTDNFVPITCDSRLCPDCGSRRQGDAMSRFGSVVEEWDAPTALRLSLPERVEPTEEGIAEAVDRLRDAFGKLRRRVVPPNGSHQGKRWVWASDGGAPADHNWRAALRAEAARRSRGEGDRSLFGKIERLEQEYVDRGRGIPVSELLEAGIYGVDAKQGDDGTVNVHLHVLADLPYLPQAALAQLWDDLVGAPVVDVRRVDGRGDDDRREALLETVGYAAKPPEYETFEGAVAYQKALSGSKLIQPFGSLHGNTPERDGQLVCAGCETTPAWWDYMGTVGERLNTMGTSWESGEPPPEGGG